MASGQRRETVRKEDMWRDWSSKILEFISVCDCRVGGE